MLATPSDGGYTRASLKLDGTQSNTMPMQLPVATRVRNGVVLPRECRARFLKRPDPAQDEEGRQARQAPSIQEDFSMRLFRSARWILMTLLLCLVPASSYAGVFISVGFAPPVLPVYEQPVCPEPGLMWTPGYWGYGPDGYYWVPGAWVPAPYEGALWTPGYWGWGGGLYVWHPGYWGRHVGYYGGVNYGFGYMGVGFAGGLWVGGAFRYNTAVMRVGPGIHNTYIDR